MLITVFFKSNNDVIVRKHILTFTLVDWHPLTSLTRLDGALRGFRGASTPVMALRTWVRYARLV